MQRLQLILQAANFLVKVGQEMPVTGDVPDRLTGEDLGIDDAEQRKGIFDLYFGLLHLALQPFEQVELLAAMSQGLFQLATQRDIGGMGQLYFQSGDGLGNLDQFLANEAIAAQKGQALGQLSYEFDPGINLSRQIWPVKCPFFGGS